MISVVIPIFNEEKTVKAVVDAVREVLLKKKVDHEIIVVDDHSTDESGTILQQMNGIRLIRHAYNKGYGAALKRGIQEAQGDWILTVDADGQHDPLNIPHFLSLMDRFDAAIGIRKDQGYALRDLMRGFIRHVAQYLIEKRIPDLNCGLRLVKKRVLQRYLAIAPNGFSFTSTTLVGMVKDRYDLVFVPIAAAPRKKGRSKIRPFHDSIRFFMLALRLTMLFSPLKIFIPVSVTFLGVGAYFLVINLINLQLSNITVLLLTSGMIIFVVGLLADQMCLLRREKEGIK